MDSGLVPLLARFAEMDPNSKVIVRRGDDGELVLVWASRAADWVTADVAARWRAACDEAVALGRDIERDLPVPTGVRRASVVALDATHLGVRFRSHGYETLLSQHVHGVFFMRLDEPFRWSASPAEQDALLDYAYDHLRITDVNDALCKQYAMTREAILGSAPSVRWAIAPALWRQHMRQLYEQGHTFHCVRGPRADGTWVDVEGEYICTYDDAGRITGHYGIQRDITVSRHAASELAKSRERLELAILGADIGIWDAEVASRGLYCEPRFMARLGYAESDGWRSWEWWASHIHPDDVEDARRAFADHVAGREPLMRAEYRIRKTDGSWASVLSIGKRANGRDRVVGIFVDTTERKVLQARVAASERLAALGTLAAGVGHEINNPLTYVVLTLEMMQRELANGASVESLRPLIERARYGAQRVGTVVRDLQSLARPPAGGQLADPVAVVERCLQIADHQIRHRARVVRELAPTPQVPATEDRLVQVVLNLIVNAAQALPEGNADGYWIKVATSAAHGRVLIEVSDNGVGIAPADLAHIFDAFFTTKPPGNSTGLGLSISRSIVAALGGEIDVESEPGRGSRFRINLPAAQAREPARPQRGPASTTVRRILVIDDEPVLGELVKRVLDGIEVEVETTAGGALARLRAGESFDRILCDLMMPDVTGMDFYEQVGEQVRPAIVFVTGGTFTERASSFLERVPNRRLLKPFDVDELAAALGD